MAILRGGRRIFGQDIRIGIPRDKTLTTGGILKRYGELPGKSYSSSETTLGRFAGQMAQGEGFARPTRFLVRIHAPNKLKLDNDRYIEASEGAEIPPGRQGVNSLGGQELARNVGMMCRSISMPSRDINTKDYITYGPRRQMPYAYSFEGKVELQIYGDKFLRQRMFFENWQKKIFDIQTHNMNYYDSYVGSMDIMQLGQFDSKQDDDARVTYAVRLFEVYPQTIGSYDYTYGSENEQVIVPITLNFRTWANLTIDQINGATVGKSVGDVPTIKASKDFGLFGGILNKLPPEIRRAGRDVLQTTRRSLPIGRVTGGRLFPPFG